MSAQDGTCSEGNAQQGYPSLCKNGCGFFSSVDSKGFCSVCYKDFLKKEQSSTESNSTEEVAATTASMSNLNVSVDESKTEVASSSQPEVKIAESEVVDGAVAKVDPVVSEAPAQEPEELKEVKKVKKNRCASCKKKVGLTGFACRWRYSTTFINQRLASRVSKFINFGHSSVIQRCNDVNKPQLWPSFYQ